MTDQYGPPAPTVKEVETLPFWPTKADWWNQFPHETTFSRSIKIEPDIIHEETTGVGLQSDVYLMLTLDRGGVRGDGDTPKAQAGQHCLLPRPPQAIPNPQPFAPITILPTDIETSPALSDWAIAYKEHEWEERLKPTKPFKPPEGPGTWEEMTETVRKAKLKRATHQFEVIRQEDKSSVLDNPSGGSPPAFGIGGDHSAPGRTKRGVRKGGEHESTVTSYW